MNGTRWHTGTASRILQPARTTYTYTYSGGAPVGSKVRNVVIDG
ncbi:hypothetical protein [Frankia sp. CiP3]|nr:hypothetical protein [Frankia sp. CiP3]